MEWAHVTQSYKIGQHVQSRIDRIDHAGIFSTVDNVAKGYTKRAEAVLTQKTVDLFKEFQTGAFVDAVVVGFNAKHQTLELSFRQAKPDPWPAFAKNISIGDFITGDVVMLTERKAIVEVKPGIAGIIHKNDTWIPAEHIDQVFMVDDKVRLQVIRVDHKNKLLVLSARGLFQEERDTTDSQATFKIEEKLDAALQVYKWKQTRQTRCKYTFSPIFKSRFRNIYIIDESDDIAGPMQNVLSAHDVSCQHLAAADMMKDIDAATSIALVACQNRQNAFLPRLVQHVCPSMPMLVYGTIEQIQSYKEMLDKLPKEPNYIKVPHSVQDLVKTLNIIADDEHVNAVHHSLSKGEFLLDDSPTLHKSTNLTGLDRKSVV